MARILSQLPESALRQVIHFAGVRPFGEAQVLSWRRAGERVTGQITIRHRHLASLIHMLTNHFRPFLIALTESCKEDCKGYGSFSESDWKRIDETASCAISIHSSFLTIGGASL